MACNVYEMAELIKACTGHKLNTVSLTEKPIPVGCNPLSTQTLDTSEELNVLLGDITAEEISQLEADTSYSTPPHKDSDSSSGSSVDELMLEALVEYESSVKVSERANKEGTEVADSQRKAVETNKIQLDELVDYNMSVDELDSFCEDLEDI